MKTYTVLGTTDERTSCDLCGRDDLKMTVALRDRLGNDVYFGSDCAARATGWTTDEVKLAVREAQSAEQAARDAANAERTASWESWLVEQTGLTDTFAAIQSLGGFTAARAAFKES